MTRIFYSLLRVSVAIWLASSCGGQPIPAGGTTQAYSVGLPPRTTQPWLCSPSSWNPVDGLPSSQWPAHGWCQWTNSFSGQTAYRVDPHPCQANPTLGGTMQIYAGTNCTGGCATIIGDAVNTAHPYGYIFDSDLVQVSGWYSIWQQGSPPTEHSQFIRSYKVAPRTSVYLCQGPLGNSNLPCQYSAAIGIGTGSAPTTFCYNSIGADGLFYPIASIGLGWLP